jgi:hypothetical protein
MRSWSSSPVASPLRAELGGSRTPCTASSARSTRARRTVPAGDRGHTETVPAVRAAHDGGRTLAPCSRSRVDRDDGSGVQR